MSRTTSLRWRDFLTLGNLVEETGDRVMEWLASTLRRLQLSQEPWENCCSAVQDVREKERIEQRAYHAVGSTRLQLSRDGRRARRVTYIRLQGPGHHVASQRDTCRSCSPVRTHQLSLWKIERCESPSMLQRTQAVNYHIIF